MTSVPDGPQDRPGPSGCGTVSILDAVPNEILEYILLQVVEPIKSEALGKSRLFWLRLVSSRWMRVIDGCPALWSTVVIATGPVGVAFQLDRTKQVPLSIRCEPPTFFDRALFDQCTSLLVEQIERTHSITISISQILTSYEFNVPAPNLEQISIFRTRLSLSCELFQGHMPKLRRFVLTWTVISSFPVGLENLEELELTHVYGLDGVPSVLTVASLHRILSRYPNLKHLVVDGIISYPGQFLPLHLPSLQTLTLTPDSVRGGIDTLSLFTDPPSSRLEVRLSGAGIAPDPSSWRMIVQWLHRANILNIKIVEGSGYQFGSLEGLIVLRSDPGYSPASDRSALAFSVLRDILLDAERTLPLRAPIIVELQDEARGAQGGVIEDFLKWLQVPTVTPGGETYYPLPRLREIRMRPVLFHEGHLRSILALRSANATDERGPGIRPADPIRAVCIESSPRSPLRNILPELLES
ncbi:hypothetical protein FRC04_010151 [Tulasnella sp. 424]|nr:hypothetical protein FRC04_010151 [Tulasnella sp. 424]KAG8972558.1 hypothetical protein FRC05_009791 [Tulasnella sp. 425]